jgi:hypothetical protein
MKKLSAFDSLPSGYVNSTNGFKPVAAAYLEGNHLLIPAGGNLVYPPLLCV